MTEQTHALARWMDEQGLPGAGEPLEVQPIIGGASNEILELRRGDERMVLRRPVDEIDYYVVLARFKMAVVLEGGYARWVRGEAANDRMEGFGPLVLDMAARAAELAATL